MSTVANSGAVSRVLITLSPAVFVTLISLGIPTPASGVGPARACLGRAETPEAGAVAMAPPFIEAASAGAPDWLALPLFGGEMTSIAVDSGNPQIAYVGTRDAGVFKTTDGGTSWQPARTGLTITAIRTLCIDPTNPSTVWAGTDFDGVWKSIDGGETWAPTGGGISDSMVVFNIVVDPSQSNTVFAGMAGGIGFFIGQICKSTDGGATWRQMDSGIPRYSEQYPWTKGGIFSLALNPTQPSVLVAGTADQGAFRSTDGGQSWTPINDGVPFVQGSTDERDEINALAFDPFHGNGLAGVINGGYFTFDAGAWTRRSADASPPLGFMSSRLHFHPAIPGALIAANDGLYTSSDGGATWQSKHWGIVDVGLGQAPPNTLFAARRNDPSTPGGVMKSIDLAGTWSEASHGITALEVRSVALDPSDSRTMYVGTGSGFVFASHDGGQSWTKALRHYGASSEDCNFGAVDSIAVDPRDSKVITVATLLGLYRSTDHGATFANVTGVSDPLVVAVARGASQSVYFVGSSFGNGVYRSLDGGTTWGKKNQGLPLFGDSLNPVLAVAVDPNDGATVWVGTQYGGGILRTTDGGEHWQSRGLTDENFVEAISVMPGNSNEILVGAGFGSGNIYKSIDGGLTWNKKLAGIGFVKCLVRDPRDSSTVYAGSEGYGVLRSIDGGETWQDYSGAIFYPLVYSLAIGDGDPPLLLAGSYGAGLYWTQPQIGTEPRRVRRHLHR